MLILRKYVKIRFKNRGSPCYFLSSWGQKIKNITKTEHTRLFLLTFFVSFFMAFLEQKLIYAINIGFNFVPGSFFEQDHLLDLIILIVSRKEWPKCARISGQRPMQPKIWMMIFFLALTVGRQFHRKDFRWKKYGGTRLLSEKTEALHAELNERAEAATNSYFAAVGFLQCIYLVLMAKNH